MCRIAVCVLGVVLAAGRIGAAAVPATSATSAEQPTKWDAAWIWHPQSPKPDNLYLHFRKALELRQVPAQVRIDVTAGSLYKLWVNGRSVGRGPNPADPSYYFYDSYLDIAPLLKPGRNVIAATCYAYGPEAHGVIHQNWGPGGFLLEMRDGEGKTLLGTDASWRVIQAPEWDQNAPVNNTLYGDFKEEYDSRKELGAWREDPGFDDSNWQAARTLGQPPAGPYPNLLPRQIPALTDEPILPVQVFWDSASVNYAWREDWEVYHEQTLIPNNPLDNSGKPMEVQKTHADFAPSVLLDFGRISIGYPQISVKDSKGGIIDVLYGEDLHLTRIDRFILKGGPQVLQPFNRRTFRYMKLVFPETPGKVLIDRVCQRMHAYPVDLNASDFACSDPQLNRMYEVAKWTIRLSMLDHLTDCPGRERTFYGGDLYAMNLLATYAFGDPRLARKTVRQNFAIQYPQGALPVMGPYSGFGAFYPSWQAFTGLTLLDDYRYTGDLALARELWPRFERLLDWTVQQLQQSDPHLIGEPAEGGDITKWMQGPRIRFSAWGNFPYYPLLRRAAEMARLLGHEDQARRYEATADVMRQAIRRHLVGDDGLFATWPRNQPSDQSKAHENGLLAWSGALETAAAQHVVDEVLKPGMPPSGGSFQDLFITQDAFELADATRALQYMRRTWGEMLARGATTFWESTDFTLPAPIKAHRLLSLSHGWSAGPVYLLPAYVLGIRPLEPGFAKVLIAPQPGGLAWAQGKIPTPHGPVQVRWAQTGDEFRLNVRLPDGCPAQISLPLAGPHARLLVDGVAVTESPHPRGDRLIFDIAPGEHEVVYR